MIRPRNTIRGAISASEIEAAYRKAFTVASPSFVQRILRWITKKVVGATTGNPFYFADTYYQPTDETLIKQILSADKTDLVQYVKESHDCDDFTFRLMGVFHQNVKTAAMPIFITWVLMTDGQAHAVISYCTNSGAVLIIEPQNDQIYSVPGWQLLLLCG